MHRRDILGAAIAAAVLLAIIGALALRVWWYWPEELPGGTHLDKIEKRGRHYTLYVRQHSTLSDIINLGVFEGYSPSNHLAFEEALDTRPSKFVQQDDDHYYVEYMGQHGRMQFHSAFYSANDEAGFSRWLEFLPSDLPVDSFLRDDIAINLDFSETESPVSVLLRHKHMYMTIIVENRKIDRIVWGED